jgi:hypothetical protein
MRVGSTLSRAKVRVMFAPWSSRSMTRWAGERGWALAGWGRAMKVTNVMNVTKVREAIAASDGTVRAGPRGPG